MLLRSLRAMAADMDDCCRLTRFGAFGEEGLAGEYPDETGDDDDEVKMGPLVRTC